ncbi:oocyte zinc finger protein XlCOF7.1-like isoform X2 [Ranitomeya imitator]|uniref:oocyte zinc finger protein XlCOF7.1-like isoform X2 n=1 Tax=Ranitomeya imitator TaxID=111125 RepID=UPI0037E83110
MWSAALQVEVATILDPLSEDLLYKRIFLIDPSRMGRDRDKMVKILHLTLEILYRLTGEDYTVVKKTSSERCQVTVSPGWRRTRSPITEPPPHPLIHKDINDRNILELTYKMIELLTGEVPIRCQDVTVYFSMEEWEYLEGHKDLYQDVMMKGSQPFTSPVLSSKRTTPERCLHPLLPQDCKLENPNIPQDHQGNDVTNINTTETYVSGDEQCKEEIPTHDYPDCTRSSEGHVISKDCKEDDHGITQETYEELEIIPDIPSALHSKDLSSDPIQEVFSPDSIQTINQNENNRRDSEPDGSHKGENPFACLKCGKCYVDILNLVKHEKSHKERKFKCSKCEKCFTKNAHLIRHEKSHTGEKPFSCSKCGARFDYQSKLNGHQRRHTGEKPFSCLKCGKCFSQKSGLADHQKTHSGEKPFSCSECGKCFKHKFVLVKHHRVHTGEKPFLCTECGKCFAQKSHLNVHQKTHTGEKPFLCSECGKCFSTKRTLGYHKKTHTGEKPFSCSECEKCFAWKSNLVEHQKVHTGEKPFVCLDCGKCFKFKSCLVPHRRTHLGVKPF